MINTIMFVAGVTVVLGVGVLIGSSLHTRSIDRRYRRLAQCVRQLNERQWALDSRGYNARVCDSCPLATFQGILFRERPPPVDED